MDNATSFMDTWWILGVCRYAAGCPLSFALALLLIGGAAGLLIANYYRPGGSLPIAIALALLATVLLRERNHILGDSRLWIDGAFYLPDGLPPYHEWLPTRLFGLLGGLLRSRTLIEWSLGLISTTCGIVVAVLVSRFMASSVGAGADRRTSPMAWAMTLMLPLSFVFYGHIESYALFAAALSWAISSISTDLQDRSLRPITVLSCIICCLTHMMGLVLLPAILAAVARARGKSVFFAIASAACVAAFGALLVGITPSLRWYTIANGKWNVHFSFGYISGVLNGLACVFGPLLILYWRPRHIFRTDPVGLLLMCALVGYAVLPLGVTMVLGMYSDLDLLSPGFVLATFLFGRAIAAEQRPISPARTVCAFGAGVIFLSAWLTLGTCDAGFTAFEMQLRRPSQLRSGRTYGYEILAYSYHDRGDQQKAIDLLGTALEADPGSVRLWGPLGQWELQRGDTLQAISHLERSLGANNSQRFESQLAQLYVTRGRARDAITLLADDGGWNVADPSRSAVLAVAYLREGTPDSSLSVSLRALEHDASNAIAHFNAGVACIALGDTRQALAATSAAVDLDPENRSFQLQLCRLILAEYGSPRLEQYLDSVPVRLRQELRQMLLTGR